MHISPKPVKRLSIGKHKPTGHIAIRSSQYDAYRFTQENSAFLLLLNSFLDCCCLLAFCVSCAVAVPAAAFASHVSDF